VVLPCNLLRIVMDSDEKQIREKTSARLCGKTGKWTTNSEAKPQGCPSDPHKQRWRLDVPNNCRQPLDDLRKELDLKSMGAAVDWMLPSETKGLRELREELRYEKGGQAIDWLLTMGNKRILSLTQELGFQNGGETLNWSMPTETKRLVERTRELGFDNGGQTIDWLTSMATKPMLKLYKLLGLEDGSKAIEWLLKQPSITALKNGTSPTLSSPTNIYAQILPDQLETSTSQHTGGALDPSSFSKQQSVITERNLQGPEFRPPAGNHSVPPRSSPIESVRKYRKGTGNQFHGTEIHGDYRFPSTVNTQPHHQFQSSTPLAGEKQQRNQFTCNSSGLKGGQVSSQYFDRNFSNNYKRRGTEVGHNDHRGNQPQTPYPPELRGNHAINPAGTTAPINGVDVGRAQGFQSRYLAGMPIEIHVHNNSIVSGDAFQQNHGNQFFDPPPVVVNQVFIDVSMNRRINQGIAAQNEFGNIHDWNQYQNQGGIQMGETRGGYAGSPSIKEEETYPCAPNTFGTDKAP